MKKSDLKTGMWVELRNGDRYIVIKNCNTVTYGNQEFVLIRDFGFIISDSFDENLLNASLRTEFDIVMVGGSGYVDRDSYSMRDETILFDRRKKESLFNPKCGDIVKVIVSDSISHKRNYCICEMPDKDIPNMRTITEQIPFFDIVNIDMNGIITKKPIYIDKYCSIVPATEDDVYEFYSKKFKNYKPKSNQLVKVFLDKKHNYQSFRNFMICVMPEKSTKLLEDKDREVFFDIENVNRTGKFTKKECALQSDFILIPPTQEDIEEFYRLRAEYYNKQK